MFIKTSISLLILLILVNCSNTHDTNKKSVQRIISLAPNITEMIYALGEQDKLIAVTDYCNFPEAAKKKEKIGGFLNPNLEKMITLKPDLLIGLQSHSELAQKLEGLNLRTILLLDNTVDEIFSAIDSLGYLLNAPDKSSQLLQSIKDSMTVYRNRAELLPVNGLKAMLVLGRDPGTTRNIGVIGSHNYIDSLWTLLGCQNVFSKIPMKFSQVGREAIIISDPDLIIEFKTGGNMTADDKKRNRMEWSAFNQIKAVRNKNIFVISGVYALIPGPRIYMLMRDYLNILEQYSN